MFINFHKVSDTIELEALIDGVNKRRLPRLNIFKTVPVSQSPDIQKQ